MRRPMPLTMLVGLVALAAFATTGAAQPAGPGGGGFGGPRLGMGGPSLMGRGGYLETNPESRALWERLGDLQLRLRDQQWELFELQNAERPSREAIADRSTEIRELNAQLGQVRQEIQQHWMPVAGRPGQQARPGLLLGRGGDAGTRLRLRQREGMGRGGRMGGMAGMGQMGGMAGMGQMGGMAGMGQMGGRGHMAGPSAIAIDRGKLYVVSGGCLYRYDARSLELEEMAPMPGPGPRPTQP